ncbi:MAG: valine--tRNA ligase, partial [Erysipelothrix sp.]
GIEEVSFMIDAITSIRETRAQYDVKPSKPLTAMVMDSSDKSYELSTLIKSMLENMAKVTLSDIEENGLIQPIKGGAVVLIETELVDKEALLEKLTKEKNRLENEITRGEKMLSNEKFISKAPESKVNEEKEKLEEYKRQLQLVLNQLK